MFINFENYLNKEPLKMFIVGENGEITEVENISENMTIEPELSDNLGQGFNN